MEDSDQLIRQEEAAILLGVTPRCMEGWRYKGGGPSYIQVSKRCIRYRRQDLLEWIEARRRAVTGVRDNDPELD